MQDARSFLQTRRAFRCTLLIQYASEKYLDPAVNSTRFDTKNSVHYLVYFGYAVAQLVEALCYKPEGHGLDSRWRHWNFPLT
jgi:hypothetical protein